MQARGQRIRVKLYMEAKNLDPVSSYNILAEVPGAQNPEQVVVLGGHSDSWDVGTGCMDDGGGMWSAWEAVNLINSLVQSGDLPRPRRTIRVVLWVDEEVSQRGAQTYLNDHINELNNHVLAMESDSGNFMPLGFGFSGSQAAFALVDEIGKVLLAPIGAGNMTYGDGADVDNGPLVSAGVPGGSLHSAGFDAQGADAYYFYFHHSNADTFTIINHLGMRNSVAAFAVMSYVVADMEQRLPRSDSPTINNK